MFKRMKRERVRVHLIEDGLPSIEGLLIRKGAEYEVAVPQLVTTPDGPPAVLESKLVAVPRERVAFYEVLT